MPTLYEKLTLERMDLNRKVARAICEFTEVTGIPVERLEVIHHYSNGKLDTDIVVVNTILKKV